MTPNQRLREFRKKRKLSRRDLAAQLDCCYDTIRSIELGRRSPGRELATRIEYLTYWDDRIEVIDWSTGSWRHDSGSS